MQNKCRARYCFRLSGWSEKDFCYYQYMPITSAFAWFVQMLEDNGIDYSRDDIICSVDFPDYLQESQ